MSALDAALDYARQGLPVFPCTPDKKPYIKTGFKAASTDPEQINDWWQQWPDALIGMPTGEASGIDGLDIDVKNGAKGAESLKKLVADHGQMPLTPTVQTRSGGIHYWLKHVPGARCTQSSIGDGIDYRGEGGYVIVPGSECYSFLAGTGKLPIADAPQWLVELVKPCVIEQPAPIIVRENSGDAVERARAYLAEIPGAVSGSGGDKQTFVAACRMVLDFGLSESEAFPLLSEYNSRCVPPWEYKDLVRKINSAMKVAHQKTRGYLLNAPLKKAKNDGDIAEFDVGVDEWPSLVPLESEQVPAFPIDALGGLAPMVSAVAYSVEVPIELPAGLALTVASGAGSHAFHVEVADGYCEPLQIWTAGVEKSGGRKTATKQKMAAPLYERERQLAAVHARDAKRRGAKAEILRAKAKDIVTRAQKCKDLDESMRLADEAGDLEEQADELKLPAPRLVVEDITPEHLGTMLARNGERLVLICDEAGPFEQFAGRYSDKGAGPNMDIWLQSHAGGSVRVDRGSRDPVELHAPKLALAVMPQPSVVAKLQAKDGFRGRGLLARFVWLMPQSLIGTRTFDRPPVDPVIEREYGRIINRLLDHKQKEETP